MKYAKKIISKLLGGDEIREIDEMGSSAIQEVANILTGSFFNAMSKGTGFRVDLSTPNYLQGDFESMIKNSTREVIKQTESAIVTDAELVGEKSGIRIHMIIVQNVKDARKILEQNGKKNPSEFSTLLDSASFTTGAPNSDLDDLVNELQKEKT
jgi:chemotaxis protein CheC